MFAHPGHIEKILPRFGTQAAHLPQSLVGENDIGRNVLFGGDIEPDEPKPFEETGIDRSLRPRRGYGFHPASFQRPNGGAS